ncbi:MAG: TetR/AcrR family transcriptional regulator [Desulfobacteraceae bacterium]|nr:TetR/AcrR family transcriptional regulator [Desulfobacteraceae bacterium]
MPKETFNQISLEKRENILQTAAMLFADQGFARTDVAQIAKRAGVAKGSIYNYFESKEDLYLYVCRDGIERSRQAVYSDIRPEWDLYRQIDHIFRRGVAFVLAHPQYARLYLNVASSGMERFADQLSLEVEKYTSDHLKRIIADGMSRGIVRKDVDVSLAAFLINSLYIIFVISLVSRHFQIRMKEYLGIREDLNDLTIERPLGQVVNLICDFLKPPK